MKYLCFEHTCFFMYKWIAPEIHVHSCTDCKILIEKTKDWLSWAKHHKVCYAENVNKNDMQPTFHQT